MQGGGAAKHIAVAGCRGTGDRNMHMAIVTIVCMALAVFGGIVVSNGILTSTDTTAIGVEGISVRDGEIMRTGLAVLDVTTLWTDRVRVRLENSGGVKLASFDKWDVIIEYYDDSGAFYTTWLPYVAGVPGDNEWQKVGIYLDSGDKTPEVFEPNILNPGEEMVLDARLSPLPKAGTSVSMTISVLNGVGAVYSSYTVPVYTLFTAHSEGITVSGSPYYSLKEGIAADGAAITETTDAIPKQITGRWLLHNEADASRYARHVFPLAGIDVIPAHTMTVYYHGRTVDEWNNSTDARLNIDILIRQADGSIRQTIATDVADGILTEYDAWQTVSGTYDFPEYTVVDDTDYLEIAYYGKSTGGGPKRDGSYIKLAVDDGSLAEADQTRIEADNGL